MKQGFKTAVIYARYSSDNQTEQSIEGQMRVCNDYAKNNNIVILDSYIDRAMTGTNDNRPAFQQMLKDSNKKLWDYVLVYKLDRFSRNKYETTIHKKTLKDNGVKVLSAMENIPDTPEGIILESLLEGMNQYYSAELSQKIKRGMNETRIKGNYYGGSLIYGYKIENKKVVIDTDQAEIVKHIFEQYASDVYVKDIIKELTNNNIFNKGKPFAKNTIYNMLKNEKYMGIYRFNGQIYTNIFPQIIQEELFEKVREKVENNKFGKRSVETLYLLRNKIKCGYCGKNIIAVSGTSHTGHTKRYYRCSGKQNKNNCQKEIVRKDYLEDVVIKSILKQLNNPDTKNTIVKALLKYQQDQLKENYTLNILKKELKQVQTSLNNLVKAVEQGVVTKTTGQRIKELETQEENLQKSILTEKNKSAIILTEKEIRDYYEEALKLEQNLLITLLVKQIILFNDKIQIQFNSPIEKSPDDDSQGFCFYKGVVFIYVTKDKNQSAIYKKDIFLEMYV